MVSLQLTCFVAKNPFFVILANQFYQPPKAYQKHAKTAYFIHTFLRFIYNYKLFFKLKFVTILLEKAVCTFIWVINHEKLGIKFSRTLILKNLLPIFTIYSGYFWFNIAYYLAKQQLTKIQQLLMFLLHNLW